MPSNLLGPLITSKTRIKLLLRFFLNQNLSGYLQGLSKELDENTNSVRVELNRLEQAGLLSAEEQGRRKVYRVNTAHPLTTDLSNMLRKVTGIDQLVERVVENLPGLKQVWVCGDVARGIQSERIEAVLIGTDLDPEYIGVLSGKVKKLTGKKVNAQILESMPADKAAACLLVWEKAEEQ